MSHMTGLVYISMRPAGSGYFRDGVSLLCVRQTRHRCDSGRGSANDCFEWLNVKEEQPFAYRARFAIVI